MHWKGAPAVVTAAAVLILGCAREVQGPSPPETEEPVGLFTLETDVGPLDVVSFHDGADGVRTIRVHRVTPIGGHESPEIRLLGTEDPADPEGGALTYAVFRGGVETCRLTRRLRDGQESEIGIDVREGGEALTLRVSRAEGGVLLEATLTRGEEAKSYSRFLDRTRSGDPAYVEGIQAELRAFYPSGPLAFPHDLELLYAVIGTSDWENHLVTQGATPGGGVDDGTARRIRQGCVISAVVGKISCFAARFNPWPWLLCIPAEGINIACTAWNIRQAILNDDDPENGTVCHCDCGCPN